MQIINIQTDINKQDDVFTVGKLIDYSNIKSTVTNFLAASVTEKGDVAKNSVFKVCAALNSLHIYRNHGALLIVVTKHKKDRNSFSLGYVVHYSILFSSSKTLAAYQNRTKLKSTMILFTLFHQHLYYNIIYHCVKCPNQYKD